MSELPRITAKALDDGGERLDAAVAVTPVDEHSSSEGEDGDEGDDDGIGEETVTHVASVVPTLALDIDLLVDPDTDPIRHEAEWRRVYSTFDLFLRYYFEKYLSYDDAQDVIGELWSRALRRIRTLVDPSKAAFWLIKIGRNVIHDLRKKGDRRSKREEVYTNTLVFDTEDWCDTVLDTLEVEHKFDGRVDLHEFRRHFKALSDEEQEFSILLQVEGRSHRDLMAIFGLSSIDASKSRWQGIRRKLIKAIGLSGAARVSGTQ